MIKTVIFAVSSALVAVASPALADTGRAPAEPNATASGGNASVQAPAKPAAAKRYCVSEALTGSRVPHKVCQTRDEWLAEGFDPLAKK